MKQTPVFLAALIVLSQAEALSTVKATVSIHGDEAIATCDPHGLTSVTIDVCSLKQGLDFTNVTLRLLTAPLGGNGSILRIGGSDQNDYTYNMSDMRPPAPCDCHRTCTMTAMYWQQIHEFANRTGHELMFGLVGP
jgi:hypothetical protein